KYTSNDTRPAFGNIREFTDLRVHSGIVRFFNKANPAGGIDVKEGYESTVADGLSTPPVPHRTQATFRLERRKPRTLRNLSSSPSSMQTGLHQPAPIAFGRREGPQ